MIQRRKTITARVGPLRIGGGHPVVVQSMTKVATTDVGRCVRQVRCLVKAGCDLVRIAVPTAAANRACKEVVDRVSVPLVADVHFSADRAIEAIEAGAAKIRLNPGNLRGRGDVERVIDCAKAHGVAVRIGVNEASIRDLKAEDVPPARRVALMIREMRSYIRRFERRGFTNLVLSAKSADVNRTIEVNRAVAEAFEYPVHLGLTHAGLLVDATVPSAVTLGVLLAAGIGDTIRVSVAGDPVQEVRLARQVLQALGLLTSNEPELIVCPTCGRCEIDVVGLARRVRRVLTGLHRPLRVAVMGCVVNGPGEAADADLAICAAKGKGFLYRHGQRIAVVPEDRLLDAMVTELGTI
jgi:(E)-4-hydroxy-3-methylbut-2-enyl-diphosphate synthase